MTRAALSGGGVPQDELFREMEGLRAADADWRNGRSALHVYWAGEDVQDVSARAFAMFQQTNALAPRAFPSLARMKEDILNMSLPLWRAPPGASGVITTGGTESIILAMQAMRHLAAEMRPGLRHPVVLAARSAHPAWEKAAGLLGMRVIRVALDATWRADPGAMADAITSDVVGLVASAPSLPFGTTDPVREIGQLALRHDLWLHVDACLGGYLAPFVRDLGLPVPEYDFSVPGVRSLSADLHKYGYAPKGNSLLAYRDRKDLARNRFYFGAWPKGGYETATLTGTRSGGTLAAAWAVMRYLGAEGYSRRAAVIMRTRAEIETGLRQMGGAALLGPQHLGVLSFAMTDGDACIREDRLGALGWYTSRIADPVGLQMTLTPVHEGIAGHLIRDLCHAMRSGGAAKPALEISTY